MTKSTKAKNDRSTLLRWHGNLCHLCGRRMNTKAPSALPDGVTLDHVHPVGLGGADRLDNSRLAHRICNELRACRSVHEFRIWLEELMTDEDYARACRLAWRMVDNARQVQLRKRAQGP